MRDGPATQRRGLGTTFTQRTYRGGKARLRWLHVLGVHRVWSRALPVGLTSPRMY